MTTVKLVHDKRQEMPIPIIVGAASELENFRLEHTVGIIPNARMLQVQTCKGRHDPSVQHLKAFEIGQTLGNGGRGGGLRRTFQERQLIPIEYRLIRAPPLGWCLVNKASSNKRVPSGSAC